MWKHLVLLSLIGTIGCSKIVLSNATINPKNASFPAEKLNKSTVILLPPRSTAGSPVKNETLETSLYKVMPARLPQAKFLETQDIYPFLDKSRTENAYPRFNKLINNYLAHGMFKKNELAIMKEIGADYTICVSINSKTQANTSNYSNYSYLLSMQIWQVDDERLVWDATFEGETLSEGEAISDQNKARLVEYLCEEMLLNLINSD